MRPSRLVLALLAPLMAMTTAAAAPARSPWNGSWKIDYARSSPDAKGGAPEVYRFKVNAGGGLVWEIPELGEIVTGHTDGRPMKIVRTTPSPGMTLAVTAVGPREWTYAVARNGKPFGGGRMMLVDDGAAWVDLTWGPDGPGHGAELIYVKVPAH